LSKRGLKKLVGNENIVYGNLRELSRLCPDSSTKLYIREFGFSTPIVSNPEIKGAGRGKTTMVMTYSTSGQTIGRDRSVWSRNILML
jgi:hypothetical protein